MAVSHAVRVFGRVHRANPGTPVALGKVMSSTHMQVVVGFDFSHSGQQALYRSLAVATRTPSYVLHFVCAIDPHTPLPSLATKHVDYAYAERVQQAMTDAISMELREANVADRVHFFVHARIGKPAEEILSLARDVGADLIIVGTKGLTGVERIVLGSVAEKVVREAGCNVEVARAKTYEHVDLIDVVSATEHQKYVPPHRYTYEKQMLSMRPNEWPLY
jgi:nucleotide-binding universal stress UspA family protein